MPITFEIVTDECAENKVLLITFEIVTDECAENKVMPITSKIVTDKYAKNKNLAEYFWNSNRRMCWK